MTGFGESTTSGDWFVWFSIDESDWFVVFRRLIGSGDTDLLVAYGDSGGSIVRFRITKLGEAVFSSTSDEPNGSIDFLLMANDGESSISCSTGDSDRSLVLGSTIFLSTIGFRSRLYSNCKLSAIWLIEKSWLFNWIHLSMVFVWQKHWKFSSCSLISACEPKFSICCLISSYLWLKSWAYWSRNWLISSFLSSINCLIFLSVSNCHWDNFCRSSSRYVWWYCWISSDWNCSRKIVDNCCCCSSSTKFSSSISYSSLQFYDNNHNKIKKRTIAMQEALPQVQWYMWTLFFFFYIR